LRLAAEAQKDCNLLSILADDLVAKEAWYHHTCYRRYTTVTFQTPSSSTTSSSADGDFDKVQQELANLLEKPRVVDFKNFQDLVVHKSEKKNLRRRISNNFTTFHFLVQNTRTVIYPDTITKGELASSYFKTKLELEESLAMKRLTKLLYKPHRYYVRI
jgi:hypothetical protein